MVFLYMLFYTFSTRIFFVVRKILIPAVAGFFCVFAGKIWYNSYVKRGKNAENMPKLQYADNR
jgi:hypothetical protein